MKAKKIKAHVIHAPKVQTDSINVRNKGTDINKSIVEIPHGELSVDRVSRWTSVVFSFLSRTLSPFRFFL
jgi:hypothetical protein